jgi:urease accessory protein
MVASRGELPLIVQRPLRGPHGQAVLTLLTPAGALFDGDTLRLQVECGPGTDVTLTTAAATKLNRCDVGSILFRLQARVAAGATLRYLPHALIPLPGALYEQSIELNLDQAAQAALLEVIGPGASETPFAYTSLGFTTRTYVAGSLAVRERFTLTPAHVPQFGGYTHYGSLLLPGMRCSPVVPDTVPSGLIGRSQLPGSGWMVKMLGQSAQTVRAMLVGALPNAAWLDALLPA